VEDPQHPGYSLTETDLFPAVGERGEVFSIRENKKSGEFEIFDYEHEDVYSDAAVVYSGDIAGVIREANRLERRATGEGSFGYGHDGLYGCDGVLEPQQEG
jgi:hypothetical protein